MKNNTEMVLGIEGFEQKPHIVLAWLCNNPFSAQIKKIKGQRNRERKGKKLNWRYPYPPLNSVPSPETFTPGMLGLH